MASKTINISLDEELIKKIDAAAKKDYSSRSDYIRSSVVNNLRMVHDREDDNEQVLSAAKKILNDYKQDFKNLSQR